MPAMQVRVCTVDDVREDSSLVDQDIAALKDHIQIHGLRDQLLLVPGWTKWLWHEAGPLSRHGKINEYFIMLTYGIKHPCRGKERTRMDVDKMVVAWHAAIVGLATAHDKEDEDKWEAKSDDLMNPLLTAPVKQLRQLYPKLMKVLKEDRRVPYVIWRGLEKWGEGELMVINAPDQGVVKLKKQLAAEVVALCEETVVPQLGEAMVRALMWRSEEQLQAVKTQLEAGAKPRVKGRESCLFLEVGQGKRKAVVQL